MIATLKKNKEKSVKFPGSCSVSSRNQQAKWKVVDEEEFIAILQEAKKDGEDVDDALEKVVQYNVRKREANKLLLMWEKSGKLEGFLKKAKAGSKIEDIVIKEPPKTIVSMSFVENDNEEDEIEADDVNIPAKSTIESSDVDYDTL